MARGRPPKYTERHRYVLQVLYLYGLSLSEIARLMAHYGVTMSKPQVAGQIATLGYRKDEMPRAVRQRFLDGLKVNRLDKAGRYMALPDHFFTARES
jgi:hypothetical protein